jgi:two-component system NtrC family sensor kinase
MRRRSRTASKPVKSRGHQASGQKPGKARTRRASAAEPDEQLSRLKRELNEAIEQRAATSAVLRVIRSSPTDAQPVFDMIAESAQRLCHAQYCFVYRFDGEFLHFVAHYGLTPEVLEMNRRAYPVPPGRKSAAARAVLERKVVQIPDVKADAEFVLGPMAKVGGFGSVVGVPILQDGVPVGSIAVTRVQTGLIPEQQSELLKTFADQAAIAIENVRLFDEAQQRTRDLSESLEQQTATSEVLKVISRSPGDLQPVFQTMLENATRVCGAKFGVLFRYENGLFHPAAMLDAPPAFAEFMTRQGAFPPQPSKIFGRLCESKSVIPVEDHTTEPHGSPAARYADARSALAVPMLKAGELVGAYFIYRTEVRPFTDKQIELVQNFAAQAVIAIENTRLLNELRQRTDDLAESLEQQTATSEVLKVISSSPGELEQVFRAMLENAVRICGAKFGNLWLREGDTFRIGAIHAMPQSYVDYLHSEKVFRPDPRVGLGRVLRTKEALQVADIAAVPTHGDKARQALIDLAGARTLIGVPMLKDNEVIGIIGIYREEVRPFSDKQIELVKNFAAQAVIAIENTRLLSELRESLQQQTATADVLKVISSSLNDLTPVFDTIGQRAEKLCDAEISVISMLDDEQIHLVSIHGVTEEGVEAIRRAYPMPRNGETLTARAIRSGRVCHVSDVLSDPLYQRKDAARVSGYRSGLAVPMVREGQVIGAIFVSRKQAGLFTDAQVQLLKTFADQAVIAIENVRLFNETNEALAQQTATADVLKVISRSTFDLRTVLQTLIESAARFCDADKAMILREKDGAFYRTEAYGFSREFMDYVKDIPIKSDRGSASGRALLDGRVIHIPDVTNDPEYTQVDAQRLGAYRTILCVPMLREGAPIGVLILTRDEVRPFTDKQIELVTTFADQAAIAIENVRLFESVEARTRELAKSLEDLRTTQDRLVQTEKLASLGQLTAGIAHEIKNPLNFVNNFSIVSTELIEELQDTLNGMPFDDKGRAEINELTNTLRGNLDKVVQHGKRADAIVKNMLLHSRQGSAEHRPVDINALVEESLNLAYHGARAEKQGFNITLEKSLDPSAGEVDVFPQDVTRVLLNLISNGFYAATKRKAQADGGDYEPTLMTATRNLGESVEIRIRDNGTGIPPEVKERMFNPFYTTKPAGEGTGLGLSISHDIIVKQHGGSIEVDTTPGEFTEIRITLPRSGVFPTEPTAHA